MALDGPADVAGLVRPQDVGDAARRRLAEQGLDGGQCRDQARLRAIAETVKGRAAALR